MCWGGGGVPFSGNYVWLMINSWLIGDCLWLEVEWVPTFYRGIHQRQAVIPVDCTAVACMIPVLTYAPLHPFPPSLTPSCDDRHHPGTSHLVSCSHLLLAAWLGVPRRPYYSVVKVLNEQLTFLTWLPLAPITTW